MKLIKSRADFTGTRNLWFLLLSNAVLGIPMPMLIILGSLAGGLVSPRPELATLPSSLQLLAGLFTAVPMSLFMGRYGRRHGFVLGACLSLVGGLIGAYALLYELFIPLCLAHMCFGAALVCFGYFRFAAAEVAPGDWQASAISLTLAVGLLAALVGPGIFDATRDIIFSAPFVASYLAMSAVSVAGTAPLLFVIFEPLPTPQKTKKNPHSLLLMFGRREILLAIVTAIVAQSVMVLVMTPTPLAMVGFGLSETDASQVIRWHVIGMFAPSFFTGTLINRFGVMRIVTVGMIILLVSAGIAIADITLFGFFFSLLLLGLGWNFGFIGATYLLYQAVTSAERSYIQGINDTAISIGSSASAFLSGALLTSSGWVAVPMFSLLLLIMGFLSLFLLRR